MQWTPDRNAGFSTADPGKLYLPVIQSLVYHYNHVNVEAQMAQQLVAAALGARRCWRSASGTPCSAVGEFEVCAVEQRAPCCRSCASRRTTRTAPTAEAVLCVNNLASRPQATTIRVPEEFRGCPARRPVRRQRFPEGLRRRDDHPDPRVARLLLAARSCRGAARG